MDNKLMIADTALNLTLLMEETIFYNLFYSVP